MPKRIRLIIFSITLALLTLIGIAKLTFDKTPAPFGNLSSFDIKHGADPDWRKASFINQKGQSIALEDLLNKPTILSFAFTGCSAYCPAQMSYLTFLQQQLDKDYGAENYQLLSISMAPKFDTPEAMQDFAARYSVNEQNWHFMIGKEAITHALIAEAGMKIVDYSTDKWADFNHTTDVYVLNAKGQFTHKIAGLPLDENKVDQAIRELLTEKS